jgi:nitroreductase
MRLPLPDYAELPRRNHAGQCGSLYDFIRTRHTVRDFSSRPVPRSIIETCLRAAANPNGANHQPWHFSVIGNPDIKARIRAAAEEEEQAFYAGGQVRIG